MHTALMALLDYCVWTRGPADDYNRLAKLSGDPGWSWDKLLPYFKKVRCPNSLRLIPFH